MDRLRESLREAPIVEKDDYHYFVHPITDGVPALRPELLREIAIDVVRVADVTGADKIVAPEAMGIPVSTAVSLLTDIPIVVVRKRSYGLGGEVPLSTQTGYGESDMYVNDIVAGDRVVVLDDVLSTGGTLAALLPALEEIGAEILDTVVVVEKVGGENALDETGYEPTTLVQVDVVDGELVIVDEHDGRTDR
jgi:adenine phosphoribosyltransferase